MELAQNDMSFKNNCSVIVNCTAYVYEEVEPMNISDLKFPNAKNSKWNKRSDPSILFEGETIIFSFAKLQLLIDEKQTPGIPDMLLPHFEYLIIFHHINSIF